MERSTIHHYGHFLHASIPRILEWFPFMYLCLSCIHSDIPLILLMSSALHWILSLRWFSLCFVLIYYTLILILILSSYLSSLEGFPSFPILSMHTFTCMPLLYIQTYPYTAFPLFCISHWTPYGPSYSTSSLLSPPPLPPGLLCLWTSALLGRKRDPNCSKLEWNPQYV